VGKVGGIQANGFEKILLAENGLVQRQVRHSQLHIGERVAGSFQNGRNVVGPRIVELAQV
jgi:hypothetical protein